MSGVFCRVVVCCCGQLCTYIAPILENILYSFFGSLKGFRPNCMWESQARDGMVVKVSDALTHLSLVT